MVGAVRGSRELLQPHAGSWEGKHELPQPQTPPLTPNNSWLKLKNQNQPLLLAQLPGEEPAGMFLQVGNV